MLDPLIDLLNSKTPVYPPIGSFLVIAGLFVLAWLVERSSGWLAMRVLDWHDRRQSTTDLAATGKMLNLKRRETLVSIIRAALIYIAFGTAIVLSIGQLAGGVDRLTAIAGASFLIIVAAFAAQRVLVDILADRDQPEVARLRAFGRIAAYLSFRPTTVTTAPRRAA